MLSSTTLETESVRLLRLRKRSKFIPTKEIKEGISLSFFFSLFSVLSVFVAENGVIELFVRLILCYNVSTLKTEEENVRHTF